MKDIKIEGFSVTIEEGPTSSVKMSALQCDSFDFFESDIVNLTRINASTILVAFKQESPDIKYRLIKSQNTLQIEFMIALDFLPPFSESVILQRIIGQEARMKIINNQIKAELSELEALLSKFKISNSRVQQKNQSLSLNNGQIWQEILEQGAYLVQLSGFLTYDYGQNYDQYFDHSSKPFPAIQVGIEEAKKKRTIQTYTFYSGPEYSYQQPFSFSILITTKQEGKAYANLSNNATLANHIYFSNIISAVTMISS